jgi:hypothetical protein
VLRLASLVNSVVARRCDSFATSYGRNRVQTRLKNKCKRHTISASRVFRTMYGRPWIVYGSARLKYNSNGAQTQRWVIGVPLEAKTA